MTPKEIAGHGPGDDDNHVEETNVSESQVGHSRTTRLISAWLQHRSSPYPDLADKITGEHIDKTLDIANEQNKRVADDRRDSRAFVFRMLLAVGVSDCFLSR